ncbi:hypothetical protein MFFC18_22120 [Mariniblastus fucicola]|uniref:Uncharacterized protein n=1 Tax=Mariniblastus fucicola TaxID=980251 RepID=A0A5B9PBP5_9BACT|nr:hypothetical protein MFFC18_22120 [Mariniblastus fucicola]
MTIERCYHTLTPESTIDHLSSENALGRVRASLILA